MNKKWFNASIRIAAGLVRWTLGVCTLSFACFSGCSSWYRNPKIDETTTTTIQPALSKSTAPDSVTIETALVRFDEPRIDELQNVWTQADESILDFSQRRLLDTNGVRVGVIRNELPARLLQQMELSQQSKQSDVIEQIGLGADADARVQTIVCRAGKRKEIVVRKDVAHPLSVITTTDGNVSGHLFDLASTVLVLTVYPLPDGKAIVEVLPEVQHGEQRKSFVASEFGMRQEIKRESKTWKQFKIRATLARGEVLMISSTNPSKALGHAFFTTETMKQTEEQVVILVRLASTNMDNLFSDELVGQARTLMEHP